MKRLIALFLALALTVGTVPAALAEESEEILTEDPAFAEEEEITWETLPEETLPLELPEEIPEEIPENIPEQSESPEEAESPEENEEILLPEEETEPEEQEELDDEAFPDAPEEEIVPEELVGLWPQGTVFTLGTSLPATLTLAGLTRNDPVFLKIQPNTTAVYNFSGTCPGIAAVIYYYEDGTSFGTWTANGSAVLFRVELLAGKTYYLEFKLNGGSLPLTVRQEQLSTPVLAGADITTGGVCVRWNAVPGAGKYAVFSKTGSEGWKRHAAVTGTSYTVTGLTSGSTYTFTVRCISADGKTYTSDYDHTGLTRRWLAAPQMTSVSNASTGILVRWNPVPGAVNYRVFRKTATGSWTKAADTTGTAYTVTGLDSGSTYTFTVRCISADGKSYTSDYDHTGKTISWQGIPKLVSVTNYPTGVNVQWNALQGVNRYRVFWKTGSGNWTKAADTNGTAYTVTGLTGGTSYTFTVRGISADGKTYLSDYDHTGKSIVYIPAPVLRSAVNGLQGVQLKWDASAGAAKYAVFWKTGSGNWVRKLETTGTSCILTGLTVGTTYTFTVRCISADGKTYTSNYDSKGLTLERENPVPQLTAVTNEGSGVKVTWAAIPDAAKYRVFWKTGSGSWTKAADTTGTSYTVTGLTGGTSYTFTVRCISADGKTYTSDYDHTGKTIVRMAVPKLTMAESSAEGIAVQWEAVPGAAKYRVFWKTASGNWTKAEDTTETSCTVKGLTAGPQYTFTVRCISADGKTYTSDYDHTGKTAVLLSMPKVSTVQNAVGGVQVQWNAVPGAAKYRVFSRIGSGSWTTHGDTASTSFTVTGLTSGQTYVFTVRCVSSDGKRFTSGYDYAGKALRYLAAPRVVSAISNAAGVTVNWETVMGADQYKVLYKIGAGTWVGGGCTKSNSLTIEGLNPGGECRVSVVCTSPDGTVHLSAWDQQGTLVGKAAAAGMIGQTIHWILDSNGTLTVSGSGDWEQIAFYGEIPWISHRDKITRAVIGNGITTLHRSAFQDCTNLTQAVLPSTLSAIGADAFSGCIALTGINLEAGLQTIGAGAFSGCGSLTAISIPDGLTSIGEKAFSGCRRLATVILPDSVTELGTGAFSGCAGLKNMRLSSSLTGLPNQCFYGCSAMTAVTIPAKVQKIGSEAFAYSGLTAVTLPDTVKTVGDGAFRSCTKLASIRLPSGLTTVGSNLLDGCSALTGAVIPGSATSVGTFAFRGCSAMQSLVLPYSLKSINAYAFAGCKALRQITLPGQLATLGIHTFDGCTGLSMLTLPASLRSVGSGVFYGCTALANLRFEGNLPTMAGDAFTGLKALAVYPAGNISYNNASAYGGEVTWFAGSSQSDAVSAGTDGSIYWSLSCGGTLTISGSGAIPDHPLQNAPWAAYAGYTTSIVICPGVTVIGDSAFYGFGRAVSVTIPNTVTAVKTNAFAHCTSLTEISFPGSVQTLGYQILKGASGLQRVYFSGKPASIDANAFAGISAKASCAANAGWTAADKKPYGGLVW